MPFIVVFGFVLTFLVSISFFGLCLYICFQCYTHRFSEGDPIGGENQSGNGETTTTRRTTAMAAADGPEEVNRRSEMAMEKLRKASREYDEDYEEEGGSELSECAICLEEFGDRVSCRVFPNCNHMFHTKCIVNWLGINQTCPICRTHL